VNPFGQFDATTVEDLGSSRMGTSGVAELRTAHCRFVPVDMRIISELETAMLGAGFRGDQPTIFISECVLVYMQSIHGDNIIQWANEAVPHAPCAMVCYEQTNPKDNFGKMMVDNLMLRGCPLLSIYDYPTMQNQKDRYLQRGWERCVASNMNNVYNKFLDRADVERIQKLEFLDELEEWYLIQDHYFLMVASRGTEPTENDANRGGWIYEVGASLATDP